LAWKLANGEKYIQCANLGDSLAYLFRGDQAILLTKEHKVTNEEEQMRILSEGIPIQTRLGGIINLSRALGDRFIKDNNCGMSVIPHVSLSMRVKDGDSIVIASDGLWDIINGKDIISIVSLAHSAKQIADTLLNYALAQNCTDNITIIVCKL